MHPPFTLVRCGSGARCRIVGRNCSTRCGYSQLLLSERPRHPAPESGRRVRRAESGGPGDGDVAGRSRFTPSSFSSLSVKCQEWRVSRSESTE
eukprot:scaffold23382_cov36-Tisochrysis_lutea.AAC.2